METEANRIWRDKLQGLTNGLGPIGDAVFKEIEMAVEDALDEAVEIGEKRGEEFGRWAEKTFPF